MKRTISLILALLLLATCVACSQKPTDSSALSQSTTNITTMQGVTDAGDWETTTTVDDTADQTTTVDGNGTKPMTGSQQKPATTVQGQKPTTTRNTTRVDKVETVTTIPKTTVPSTNKTTLKPATTTTTTTTATTTTTRTKVNKTTTAKPITVPHYTTAQKVTKPSAEDTATYTKQSHTVQQLADAGKWLAHGRAAVINGQFQMDWSNAGFEIKGKLGGDISITTVSGRSSSLLNVIIDEGDPILVRVANGTNSTTIVTGLPKGQHTIKVISGTSIRQGTLTVTQVDYEGELQTIQRDPSRLRIEVLGDSITCGWGLDYSATAAKNNPIEISNSYYSYAAVAARYLNADLQVVALCAQGIPNIHGFFPYVNRRTKTAWDFENNQQDIVVINLGTNDESRYTKEETATNMTKLLTDVREKYPDAYIIWVYGMMRKTYEAQYKKTISDMNDDKMFTLDLSATKGTGGYDGNHPKRENHELAADYLIDFILKNCK